MKYIVCKDGGIYQKLENGLYQRVSNQDIKELCDTDIIRDICSLETIRDVLERMAFITTIQAPSSKIYQEFYEEAMSQYNEIDWVKVIKTVYIRSKTKKVQSFEKRYSDMAKEYLYSEISVLLKIPYLDIEQYIIDYIHNDQWDETL